MPITVTARISGGQAGPRGQTLSAEFDDKDDFLNTLYNHAGNLFDIFGQGNVNGIGSDTDIVFDVVNARGGVENVSYQEAVRASFDTDNILANLVDIPGIAHILAERGSNQSALFEYSEERVFNLRPRRNAVRFRGQGGLGGGNRRLAFGNTSSKIAEFKTLLQTDDMKQKVLKVVLDALKLKDGGRWVHMRFINNQVAASAPGILRHYQEMGCFLLCLELYYGRSPLHKLFQVEMGIEHPAGMERSASLPRQIYRLFSAKHRPNEFAVSVLQDLDGEMPLLDGTARRLDHAFTEIELCRVNVYLGVDFYLYRTEAFLNIVNVFGKDVYAPTIMDHGHTLAFRRLVQSEAYSPLLVYRNRGPDGNRRNRSNREADTFVFIVSDIWGSTMHLDPEWNYNVVRPFAMRAKAWVMGKVMYREGRYNGVVSYLDTVDEDKRRYGMYQVPCYLRPDNDFTYPSKWIGNTPRVEKVINTAAELKQHLYDIRYAMNLHNIAHFDGGDKEEADAALVKSMPDVVRVSSDVFYTPRLEDRDLNEDDLEHSRILHPDGDYTRNHGVNKMIRLLAVIIARSEISFRDPESLKGVHFASATPASSGSLARKLVSKRERQIDADGDTMTGTHKLQDVQSFSVYISTTPFNTDQGANAESDMRTRLQTTFTYGSSALDVLGQRVLEDKNGEFSLTKIVNRETRKALKRHKIHDVVVEEGGMTFPIPDALVFEESTPLERLKHRLVGKGMIAQRMRQCNPLRMVVTSLYGKEDKDLKTPIWSRTLSAFEESCEPELEKLKAFDPLVMEPIVIIVEDGRKYQQEPTLVEMDLNCNYASVLQGGFSDVLCRDLDGEDPQVGCIRNGTWQPLSEPVTSYYTDYGMVFIECSRIDWDFLQRISPDYFSDMGSWSMHRRVDRLVETYVVIDLCEKLCELLHITGREEKVELYRAVQMEGLGIEVGYFDCSLVLRQAMRIRRQVNRKHWMDTLYDDFRSLLAGVMETRILLPVMGDSPRVRILPVGEGHHSRVKTSRVGRVRRKDGPEKACFKRASRRGDELFAMYSNAVVKMVDSCASPEEGRKMVKHACTRYIGQCKFRRGGGLRMTSTSDLMDQDKKAEAEAEEERGEEEEEEEEEEEDDEQGQEPASKKRKTMGEEYGVVRSVINASDMVMSAHSIYWCADLPDTNCRSLVINTQCQVELWRNSHSPLRRYIMNISRVVMDRIVTKVTPFRVMTDSVLVRPQDANIVRGILRSLSHTHAATSYERMVPGYMPSFKEHRVDMTLPVTKPRRDHPEDALLCAAHDTAVEANVLARSFDPTCPLIPTYLSPKYRIVKEKRCTMWLKGGEDGSVEPEQENNETLIDCVNACKGTFSVTLDSDRLWEFYDLDDCPFGELAWNAGDGHELHRALYSEYSRREDVRDFYTRFGKWSATYIAEMRGCLLVGDPGAGKSYRTRDLCSVLSAQRETIVMTSVTHAVVQLYNGVVIAEGEDGEEDTTLDCMTLHRFVGCGINPETKCKNPGRWMNAKKKGALQSISRSYSVCMVDEIETVDKSFEEFLRYYKEAGDRHVYLIGDPLQSAGGGERGWDVHGSMSRYLCNGNEYRFDLQFRNIDQEYARALSRTAQGVITDYLHPSMCQHSNAMDAVAELDGMIVSAVEDILDGEDPAVFVCPSYKMQATIVTEVLRRTSMKKREWMDQCDVLVHVGQQANGDGSCAFFVQDNTELFTDVPSEDRLKRQARFCGSVYRGPLKRTHLGRFPPWKTENDVSSPRVTEQTNGPDKVQALVGLPLVMKKGMTFRVLARFQPKTAQPNGDDSCWTEKSVSYTYKRKTKKLFQVKWNGTTSSSQVVNLYTFHRVSEKPLIPDDIRVLTSSEVCMYLMYSFCIQRDFIIGATMSAVVYIQPVCIYQESGEPISAGYAAVESMLQRQQDAYGELAKYTDLARFMRVCVTRTTERGKSRVLDLTVPGKYYWEDVMWSDNREWMVSMWNDMTPQQIRDRTDRWRDVIMFGCKKLTELPTGGEGEPCVIARMSTRSLRVPQNVDDDFTDYSFPSYLSV